MNLALVRAEWQRAAYALGAADVLQQAGYPADALSRAYYATLHAAKAALAVPIPPNVFQGMQVGLDELRRPAKCFATRCASSKIWSCPSEQRPAGGVDLPPRCTAASCRLSR